MKIEGKRMSKEKEDESLDFKNRYLFEVEIEENSENINEARENYAKLTSTNIKRMRKIANRSKAMDYFDNSLLNINERVEEVRRFKEKGGKVIGVFCIQVPEELIYAVGAVPIRLSCGFYDSIPLAEEIVPKNICPLIKSSIGFNFLKINPLFEFCDVIIIPTTCDGKKKMADILSNYRKVWALELPNSKDNPDSRDFWVKQIYNLKSKLENLTGRRISKKDLKESIKLLHKRTALVRELLEIRKQKGIALTGRDAYLVMQVAFFDDIKRWMLKLDELIKELKNNLEKGITALPYNTPRIIMTGSALIWPNMKLLHAIEESGAVVVGDDSCACSQYFYNPAELDEWSTKAMLEAISDKALLPTVCPIYVHSDDRVDRLLELIEQYKADGVVYHVLRLCQVFDFEFKKISKVLEKKDFPLLKIETEYSEEDIGQIKTRIEAFVEMLEARK
jgi:benzoyl-CoA reductase/2-hydroxyglutaryl-CoA dehydratase subunit BcrC/BadD/HgdB